MIAHYPVSFKVYCSLWSEIRKLHMSLYHTIDSYFEKEIVSLARKLHNGILFMKISCVVKHNITAEILFSMSKQRVLMCTFILLGTRLVHVIAVVIDILFLLVDTLQSARGNSQLYRRVSQTTLWELM